MAILSTATSASGCVAERRSAPMRRLLPWVALCLATFALVPAGAAAHATLLESAPAAGASLASAPAQVRLRFNEPVQLLGRTDVSVVAAHARPVAGGAARSSPRDASVVVLPLRRGLGPGSYTVRYRVLSADGHAIQDALVFGTGGAAVGAPVLGAGGGLSEESPLAVAGRLLELLALALLLALPVFRWVVWEPAVRALLPAGSVDRVRALAWSRSRFSVAHWSVLGVAIAAEAVAMVIKTGTTFGLGFGAALTRPGMDVRLLAETRYGSLLQVRWALVVALLVAAVGLWLVEAPSEPGAPRESDGRRRCAVLALLPLAALGVVSLQGHASQAPLGPLSIAADALHLGAVAIWLGGLPCLVVALRAAPRIVPVSGRKLAASVLGRFSALALAAVAVLGVTGLARAVGELSDPAQLWDSAYGRSLIYKTLLLWPIAFLAFRTRRVIVALARRAPNDPTLRLVRRSVGVEFAIGLAIVVVATVLAAQVPGRV